jgi:hypothetical protein
MRTPKLVPKRRSDFGYYVASLGHIGQGTCRMCSFFYSMRWGDSAKQDYHLHAFSARRILHDKTLIEVRREWSLCGLENPPQDAVFYGVVPDDSSKIDSQEVLLRSCTTGLIAICNSETVPKEEMLLPPSRDGPPQRGISDSGRKIRDEDSYYSTAQAPF